MSSESDEYEGDTLFQDPEGFYEPEKAPTTAQHTLRSGEVLQLGLVGHNPLWVSDGRF